METSESDDINYIISSCNRKNKFEFILIQQTMRKIVFRLATLLCFLNAWSIIAQ